MKKREKPIDWAGIETDYLDGRMSVREMGRWYGVTEAAIRKKAKAEGWQRAEQPSHVERVPLPTVAVPDLQGDLDGLNDRARGLAGRMMNELSAVTSMHGELEEMICAEESDPRRRQALLKAISLGERAMTLKNLSAVLKTMSEADAPEGKKAQRQAKAEQSAAEGRFAAPAAPRQVSH